MGDEAIPDAAPKRYRAGTHRTVDPRETLDWVRPFMARMGITRIANVTGLDVIGIPVVMVCRPNSRALAVAQGKGLDLDAARASGLMESVEGWHAERIPLPLKLASHREMRAAHECADVGALPRHEGGAFHDDLRILWIEGRDVATGAPVWLPFELCHTDFTLPPSADSGSFHMTSNGLASGNHLLEAQSHALCEVIERDASALWHLLGEEARARTLVDTATVDDPCCREALERLDRGGVDVAVWETTGDVGVASFHCSIADRDPSRLRPLGVATGMGCHPAREVALLRALTEAAQSRLTLISGARDDIHRRHYEGGADADAQRSFRALLSGGGPRREFRAAPTRDGETFAADVAWELERLRAAGLPRAVVVDLTDPEMAIPVVRVVVPGLEGPCEMAGYVPGQRARRAADRAS